MAALNQFADCPPVHPITIKYLANYIPLAEAETCYGFGGLTSLGNPEVAAGILGRKLDTLAQANATTVLTANPGCVLHLRGGVDAAGLPLQVRHVAEYLAERLPPAKAEAAPGP